jgi:hypothetical protein
MNSKKKGEPFNSYCTRDRNDNKKKVSSIFKNINKVLKQRKGRSTSEI